MASNGEIPVLASQGCIDGVKCEKTRRQETDGQSWPARQVGRVRGRQGSGHRAQALARRREF